MLFRFQRRSATGGLVPTFEEIKEDLLILIKHWKYIRLYDCDEHAEIVLNVIEQEKLPFQVMLGVYIVAEMNNFGCPWGGSDYTERQLQENRVANRNQIKNGLIQPINILQ